MDTRAYSFAYVARWSAGETELIKETAERSVDCARKILSGVDLEALTPGPANR